MLFRYCCDSSSVGDEGVGGPLELGGTSSELSRPVVQVATEIVFQFDIARSVT